MNVIYQRQNNTIIESGYNSDIKIKKYIQGGYKYYFDNKMVYSTKPLINKANNDLLEWVYNNEKCLSTDDLRKKYNNIKCIIEKMNSNEIDRFVLRQKIETLCVNNKKSILYKYEFKINSHSHGEKYMVCSGGTGNIDDILENSDFYSQIIDKNKLYNVPIQFYKYNGKMPILLGNCATGFLCHEAIGHMAESDNMAKGSVFYGKIGKRLFHKKISIIDSGDTIYGAGNIIFDEEGTYPNKNYIIREGVLDTYLTDKAYARKYNIKNTGNRRASSWNQCSNIRMTNTYMLPGKYSVSEIISSMNWGIYILSVVSGNCYLDGRFLLRSNEAYLIQNGKITFRLNNIIIDEEVFSIFNNIYAIGNDLKLCLGASSCGKGGSIKVDAGGPHILTEANVRINYEYK